MQYNNIQDERAHKLLERIKSRNITIKDRAILAWLREGGSEASQYLSGHLAEAYQEAVRMSPYVVQDDIISITHTAELWGVSTSTLSADYRSKGYEIKYDRNKKYCKDRVITYVEVK